MTKVREPAVKPNRPEPPWPSANGGHSLERCLVLSFLRHPLDSVHLVHILLQCHELVYGTQITIVFMGFINITMIIVNGIYLGKLQ